MTDPFMKPGNAARKAAEAFDICGLTYDKDVIEIWADICEREFLIFTPGYFNPKETADQIMLRIADAGRVVLLLKMGTVEIYLNMELLK